MSIWDDPSEVQGRAGIESMFYVADEGEPWHGLGKSVTNVLTSEDAFIESGQNWTVRKEAIQTVSGLPIGGRRSHAVVREDRNIVLGVVGGRYKPIQNKDAFNFMDSLAANRTIRYHTAGVLGQGERIWILAQLHGDIVIPKTDDTIKKFLLFSNSHDGGGAGRCFWTPIRVVCANTLNQATGNAKGEGISIRHTGNLKSKIAEAQRILALSVKAYDDLETQIFASARFKISDAQRKAYFDVIYGPGAKGNDEDGNPREASTRTRNVLERLERLFHEGRGNDAKGVRGTAWAAYNAVTEYTDFYRPTRLEGDPAKLTDLDRRSKRLDSIWFGSSARLKERAWDLTKQLVGVN